MSQELRAHAPDDYCYLTTRGRVTGRPHEIEIWFAMHPEEPTIYLLAGGGDSSDWVRNLRADPTVSMRVGDATYAGTGRVVEQGTDEDERARTLVFEKFQPRSSGGLDSWRVSALAVAIDLAVAVDLDEP